MREGEREREKANVDAVVSPGARRLRNDGPFKRPDHRSTSWNLNGRGEGHHTRAGVGEEEMPRAI